MRICRFAFFVFSSATIKRSTNRGEGQTRELFQGAPQFSIECSQTTGITNCCRSTFSVIATTNKRLNKRRTGFPLYIFHEANSSLINCFARTSLSYSIPQRSPVKYTPTPTMWYVTVPISVLLLCKNKSLTHNFSCISPHDDDIKPNTVEGPSATVEMCQYCFDIVIRDLSKHTPSKDSLASFMDGLSPTIECPLFVTWDLKDMSSPVDYTLRGCIGTLSPRPLATAIRDYALTSAFHDNRFEPVRLDEVPNLRVGVSLLVKYEECRDSLDWVVGVHGILIKFCANGMDYSATYLPEVAQQQRYACCFKGLLVFLFLSNI